MTIIDLLVERGFIIIFELSRPLNNENLIEMFGSSIIAWNLYDEEYCRNRRWFVDFEHGEPTMVWRAWYGFKDEDDAILFKLAFSTPEMITRKLQG